MTTLADGARYPLIVGGAFTADIPSGSELHVSYRDAAGADQSSTVTATADGAAYTPLVVGRYYLGWRRTSAEPVCPAGVIDVTTLVDDIEEQLVEELHGVNEQIRESRVSLIQYQISDPSGTAATRMTLEALNRTRARLEIRLARYRREQQGILPARMS